MANRWIILLDKSPKGPVNEEEIRALLEKGILRRNDIAYQLPTDSDSKTPTEWKLIWQFDEFNRRKDSPASIAPAPSTPQDRRSQQRRDTVDVDKIPRELLDISPQDLLPKSTTLNVNLEKERVDEIAPLPALRPGLGSKWIYAGGAAFLSFASFLAFYFSAGTQSPTPRQPTAETFFDPTPVEAVPNTSTRPALRMPSQTPMEAPERRFPAPSSNSFTEAPDVAREAEHGEIPQPEEDLEDLEDAPPKRAAKSTSKNAPNTPPAPVRTTTSTNAEEEDEPASGEDLTDDNSEPTAD